MPILSPTVLPCPSLVITPLILTKPFEFVDFKNSLQQFILVIIFKFCFSEMSAITLIFLYRHTPTFFRVLGSPLDLREVENCYLRPVLRGGMQVADIPIYFDMTKTI